MTPSFHRRIEMKDDFFRHNSNGHKTGGLHATSGTAALDAPSHWPTKASLQWFQCIRHHWQNSPRNRVQPIAPFLDGDNDGCVNGHSETLLDSNNHATSVDANETEVTNIEESLVEDDERKSGLCIDLFHLDPVLAESQSDEHRDTSTDFSINESREWIDSSRDAALNITTSTGSSLQEQIELLHQSIDESKERLIHTKTQLDQHIELLKSRQLKHRGGLLMVRRDDASFTAQTVEGISSSPAIDETMVLGEEGAENVDP